MLVVCVKKVTAGELRKWGWVAQQQLLKLEGGFANWALFEDALGAHFQEECEAERNQRPHLRNNEKLGIVYFVKLGRVACLTVEEREAKQAATKETREKIKAKAASARARAATFRDRKRRATEGGGRPSVGAQGGGEDAAGGAGGEDDGDTR